MVFIFYISPYISTDGEKKEKYIINYQLEFTKSLVEVLSLTFVFGGLPFGLGGVVSPLASSLGFGFLPRFCLGISLVCSLYNALALALTLS